MAAWFEVDVGPAQGQELAASGAGHHGQMKVGEEVDVGLAHGAEEMAELLDRRGPNVGRFDPRWRGQGGGVQADPLPANGLGEGPMQHDVNPVNRGWAQRPLVATTAAQHVRIDVVDVSRGQFGDLDVAEVREEMAAHQAAGLPHRRRRPRGRRRSHPPIEELTNGSCSHATALSVLDQLGQRGRRRPSAAVHGPRGVPTSSGVRIEAEVDPQLPGSSPPLAYRSGHHRPPHWCPTGQPGPGVMGK